MKDLIPTVESFGLDLQVMDKLAHAQKQVDRLTEIQDNMEVRFPKVGEEIGAKQD